MRFKFDIGRFSLVASVFMPYMFKVIRYYLSTPPSSLNSFEIPESLMTEDRMRLLRKLWENEEKSTEKPSFYRCVMSVYRTDYIVCIVFQAFSILLTIMGYVMIYFIYEFLLYNYPDYYGYVLAVVFAGISFFYIVFRCFSLFNLEIYRCQLAYLLTRLVQEKVLKINLSAVTKEAIGNIVSSLSTDMESLFLISITLPLFAAPLTLCCCMAIIIWIIGPIGLLGVAVSLFHIPIIALLSKTIFSNKIKSEHLADARIFNIKSFIEGIRVLKIFAWEKHFLKKIHKLRDKECKHLRTAEEVKHVINSLSLAGILLSILVTLVSYYYLEGSLKYSESLVVMGCLFLIQLNITYVTLLGLVVIFTILQLFNKVQKVLSLPEYKFVSGQSESISLKNLTCRWDLNSSDEVQKVPAIKDINLQINPGELVMVIGDIGAGKTALLLSILGELEIVQGSIAVPNAAFYSESPWIIRETIKENIIMGRSFNYETYEKVLECCCLKEDIEKMPGRDETLIEDDGHTVSGGQRARIALARVVYSKADCYLFDDPFSSLDKSVKKKTFYLCMLEYLKGTTRVLVCRNTEFLQSADKILVVSDGKIVFTGNFSEYQNYTSNFSMEKVTVAKNEPKEDYKQKELIPEIPVINELTPVNMQTYVKYFRLGHTSVLPIIGIFFLYLISQVCYTGSFYFVMEWSASNGILTYLYICISIILLFYLIQVFRTIPYVRANNASSKILHRIALKALANTSISYFDKNSTGRITSKFSKDISTIDGPLQHYIIEFTNIFFPFLGAFFVISIAQPISIFFILLFIGQFWIFCKYVVGTNSRVKRLESNAKGPVVAFITSVLAGLSTIRSMGLQRNLIIVGEKHANKYFRAGVTSQLCIKFFEQYLEIGLTLVNIANFAIIIAMRGFFSAEIGLLGISSTLSLQGVSSAWFWLLLNFDNAMVSCQRLFELAELPNEHVKIHENFNKTMQNLNSLKYFSIEFINVEVKYDENTILKDLSFLISGRQKVGIIGRTGAGKSTIFNVLIRMINLSAGQIKIAGYDYTELTVKQLRETIAVNPQSTLIFAGSLRDNLDPYHKYSDKRIYKVLGLLNLNKVLNCDLDSEKFGVTAKLSSGEKQLLNLARVLLKKCKIVLIDEAISNADKDTEEIVQKVLKKKLKKCTALVITHKVETAMNLDRILIISDGKLLKFDTVQNLIEENNALFLKALKG